MADYESGISGVNAELSFDRLEIEGTIPQWLTGTLIRNGPGAFVVGRQILRHWFDGPAMLHKFSFQDGSVNYASKFLECDAHRTAQEAGRLTYSEFATDPCRSLFQRVMTLFSRRPTDSAKVSIGKFADRFLALAETPLQVQFDPETLKSVGVFLHEDNEIGQMTTPHPHFADDAMYNVVTRYHRISHYRLYKTPQNYQPQQIGSIATQRPAYMHSFGMTQNYAIVTEFPFTVNPINLLLWMKPFIENFHWNAKKSTKWWVMNRHTGEIISKYESDPFFAFHHVNAFEQNGEIIVDIVGYEDSSIVSHYYLNRLKTADIRLPHGNLRRYRIQPGQKRISYETLSDTCIEMPRFDSDRFNFRENYQYVYGIGVADEQQTGFYNQIVKIDVKNSTPVAWKADQCYPGEPIFVPSPESSKEDEGVILSVVLDTQAGKSFLLVLDAESFQEIGRAVIPQAILFGYHGEFFSPDAL